MIIDADFQCAYCGEINATTIDPTAGWVQDTVEDCQVCCRPNRLHITIDPESLDAVIEADAES